MASRLLNECRWSSSRESTFSECKKRYWYMYYGAWEGWPKTPFDQRVEIDPLAAYLYMMKNMQSSAIFIGSMVHKVIEWSLRSAEKTKKLPTLEENIERFLQLFQQGLADSLAGRWRESPKYHVNLLEHYYRLPFGEDEQAALEQKGRLCLEHWYHSACVQNLLFHPSAEWLGIEIPQMFVVDGIEAIVVFDFYLRWKKSADQSMMIIFDWKTGKPSPQVESQMAAYALAATTLFGISYEELILSPFYLSQGPTAYKKYGVNQEIPLTKETCMQTKDRIMRSAKEMLALHPPKNAGGVFPTPDPEAFSYTDDRRNCRRCPFQELCHTAQFESKAIAELRDCVFHLISCEESHAR